MKKEIKTKVEDTCSTVNEYAKEHPTIVVSAISALGGFVLGYLVCHKRRIER